MLKVLNRLQAEYLYNKGYKLAERHEFMQALSCFEEALTLAPEDPDVHANIGYCQYKLGKADAAITAYQKARTLAPNDAENVYLLGCIHYKQGQKELAFQLFLDALKLNPGFSDAYRDLEQVRVELKIPATDPRVSSISRAPQPPETAKPAPEPSKAAGEPARPGVQTKPRAETRGDMSAAASALVKKSERLYGEEKYEGALMVLDEAVRLAPNHAQAHNNRAAVLLALERHEEAITAATEALRLKPNYAIAHMTRGEVYASMGNRDAVMREFAALNAIDEGLARQLLELIKEPERPAEPGKPEEPETPPAPGTQTDLEDVGPAND
jgi:tetratricopeptide (TPR) repeat protein